MDFLVDFVSWKLEKLGFKSKINWTFNVFILSNLKKFNYENVKNKKYVHIWANNTSYIIFPWIWIEGWTYNFLELQNISHYLHFKIIVSFHPNMCPTLLTCTISKSCSSKTKKLNYRFLYPNHCFKCLTKRLHSCSNIWPSNHPDTYTFPLSFALLHFNKRCTFYFFILLSKA
jgi:hypothetical protein